MNLINLYPYEDYLKSQTIHLKVGGYISYEAHPDEYEDGYVVMRIVEQNNGTSVFRLNNGKLITDLTVVDQDLLDYLEKEGDDRFNAAVKMFKEATFENDMQQYLYNELKEIVFMALRELITKRDMLDSLLHSIPKVNLTIGKHMVEKLAGKENDINRCKLLTMSANILAEVK